MALTPDVLGTAAVGLLVIIAAIGQYLRSLREKPKSLDPVVAGVGLELGNRQQMDDLIGQVRRIGDILENKRQTEMEEKIDEALELMKGMKTHPPRRR